MKTAAIICEYNPFHNGHKFHIEETRRKTGADSVIAIMSGNFVQRGDIAVFDKSIRAKAAILGGADLVIELPALYSSASAEFFAYNAVKILNSLGTVDFLSFGAETLDPCQITQIAKFLAEEPSEFSDKMKHYFSEGLSFPAARSKALSEFWGTEAEKIISTPNNILGIEYAKALYLTNSSISPCPILRKGAAHDSTLTSGNIASATYIRDLIQKNQWPNFKNFIPDFAAGLFSEARVHSIKSLEKAILCELIKAPTDRLKSISDVSEGLENRLKEAALTSRTLEELIDKVKTKRYTHSRIRRIVLSAYLGITKELRQTPPQYIKILEHNGVGQKIIAHAKKSATLPIVRNTSQVNKLKNPFIKNQWELERTFDSIYDMSVI